MLYIMPNNSISTGLILLAPTVYVRVYLFEHYFLTETKEMRKAMTRQENDDSDIKSSIITPKPLKRLRIDETSDEDDDDNDIALDSEQEKVIRLKNLRKVCNL